MGGGGGGGMGELLEGASGFIIHSHIHPVNGALAVALASPGYANEVGDSWGGREGGGVLQGFSECGESGGQ